MKKPLSSRPPVAPDQNDQALRKQTEAVESDRKPGEKSMSDELETIETAIEATQKSVVSREKPVGESAEQVEGPAGLDIGTSHIVLAQSKGKNIQTVKQLNAFFTIPASKFTRKILVENAISFFEKNSQFFILGYSAENFARMFNTDTRRTMEKGLLSSREDDGINVLQAIIDTLVKRPRKQGEVICFSVPGEPLDAPNSVVYHESIIKMYLASLGYRPTSINEGLATIMSELANDNFTGIGISMGGGMCNVCLAYLSVPVITYSVQRGGDYIDSMVGVSVGEHCTTVKVVKESELSLSRPPRNRINMALQIYYEDLVRHLVQSLERVLHSNDKIPKIAKPVPIVLSGGTAMPEGFKQLFERVLKEVKLPIEISEVRLASDPLNTTAKGAMVMALSEEI